MTAHPQLSSFLNRYHLREQDLFWSLRDWLVSVAPPMNELIYDNYNALAIAYSLSHKVADAFCHIAVYSQHVNFGFNRATELPPTDLPLEGQGTLIRHMKVKDWRAFPQAAAERMVATAAAYAGERNPDLTPPQPPASVVMSISEKKRRPK